MVHTAKAARAELILSLGVLTFGLAAAVVAWKLPEGGGYARIGPNFSPKLVSGGLILLGVWLLVERFTGGWREPVASDPATRGEHDFLPSAFVWVSAGLLAQMVLINSAGFVLAAAVLFACVAQGFGSRRWRRDLALGLALGFGVFAFFVYFLNVNLPAGWLKPLLGAAGI